MTGSMRIVVVSRDERFRRGVRALLWTGGHLWLAGEAADAASAAVVCSLGRPDVVILDGLLSAGDTRDVVRCVGRIRPETRIVRWTCPSSAGSGEGLLVTLADDGAPAPE
jgi:DNA-binding NarL/FixJ family response regulator